MSSTTTSQQESPAKNGDDSILQSMWVIWCSFEASSHLQPNGPLLVSPPSIQGVMVSLEWSTFARPPLRYAAPSPRSYISILPIEDHSPIRRRWAECSEFDVNADTESVFLYSSSTTKLELELGTRLEPRHNRARARARNQARSAPLSAIHVTLSPPLQLPKRRPTAPRCAERN